MNKEDFILRQNNKSNSLKFTYKGKTQSLTLWCREFNLPYFQVRNRIVRGWTFEESVSKPISKKAKSYIGYKKIDMINKRGK